MHSNMLTPKQKAIRISQIATIMRECQDGHCDETYLRNRGVTGAEMTTLVPRAVEEANAASIRRAA
ncbi:hypothetical protein SAMN05892877_12185 [Rhizobium subbaraonis]|uniref:Uncharacterized protein n=1 Tax=Rhizobium subbaraonis TaxID=908946 RepID=A0A285UWK5_9HYPH|nr:hypothetical protein [Rhizobium subbaraonis]SOC46274.1 hypothetical protein SAMN05892877_12185 [Rhizobium subbaraonis]